MTNTNWGINSSWYGDLTDRKVREANAAKEGMSIGTYERTLRGIGIDYNKPYKDPILQNN